MSALGNSLNENLLSNNKRNGEYGALQLMLLYNLPFIIIKTYEKKNKNTMSCD